MTERAKTGRWANRNTERLRQRDAPTAVAKGELRKSGDTRARILDAAIGCLVADGYPRLSVAAVAHRAGLTRAAVIYHFAGREALLEAIVTWLIDKRLDLYWEAVRDVPPSVDQIAIFVDTYWRQVDSDLFVAFVELSVAARVDKVLAKVMQPALDRFDAERSRYSRLIFSHEMRAAAGDRFETIRDVARFLIEGLAFASMIARVDPGRVDAVKGFLTAQMKAIYGVE